MSKSYSQSRALWAIIRASFKAIFAQPTSIVFSLLFPIIFILIFGAFGNNGVPIQKIAIRPGSDTTNAIMDSLRADKFVRITHYADTLDMKNDLLKGNLTAILSIQTIPTSADKKYLVHVQASSASGNTLYLFLQSLENLTLKIQTGNIAEVQKQFIVQPEIVEGQKYRQIDFILPGQLGFSILFSTLFGISFTFFSLREQLVLKRFYASPIKRINILIGIGTSRLFFQLVNVMVLILVGYSFLHFTLQHGFITFVEMIILTMVMLFLLMGVGLIFSSVSKSDASIPLFINLFGFPQMLLSGTFFPVSVFPRWLQDICYFLPLTQFNNAMRKISFEGLHLYDTWKELGILAIWTLIIYLIVARVIKWE
ncbi:ABC transporter permease [Terrimonas pollutisoli]|uniref:ABC transporter permease n=1 Tax=Terrimonas pollutisoli TaxID=3034147 RepID=UPI0023EC895C|nr:ABC transporter permease [Terrimonas sp. H1YJ31]